MTRTKSLIAKNPIELRIATSEEKIMAEDMLIEDNRYLPEYILVSEIAFPDFLSYYSGIEGNNEIHSAGWIGKN